MSAALDVAGIDTYYGDSHVLHGVTLRVGPGKRWPCSGATGRARPR